jgi:tetratricopeptide (TPR) repeat protein
MSREFELTPESAPVVAGICARVDGMPLAIELAAARAHVLPLDQILGRLDNMFRLLTTSSRTSLPRHRTLRAALDWSYDPLPPTEQKLLRRLSVFAGGFTLAAVEAVCSGQDLPADDVLDALSQLVDKSLVVAQSSEANARYRIQETVRLYGWSRLEESGEASEIRSRHRGYFLRLAEEAEPHFRGPRQAEWLGHLEREDPNLLVALHWAASDPGEAERRLRLAGALWRYWAIRGYFNEGRQILESALSSAAGLSAARAKALHASGYLAYRMDDLRAARMRLQNAASLFRKLKDDAGTAFCLTSLAVVARENGRYAQAVSLLEKALALARRLDDKWTLSRSLGSLGVVEEFRGNYAKAARLFEESLQASHGVSDAFGIAYALEHLGAVTAMQGRHAQARAMLEQALERFQKLGDRAHVAYTQYELGTAARLEGNHDKARALLLQSLTLSREVGDRSRIARSLEGLATLAMSSEQVERAAVLFGAARVLRASIREPLPPAARREHDRLLKAIRTASKRHPLKGALARGQALTFEEALDFAMTSDPTSSPCTQSR